MTNHPRLVGLLAVLAAVSGCPGRTAPVSSPPPTPVRHGGVMPHLGLTSPAFTDGQRLPAKYTADGANVSPPLAWAWHPSAHDTSEWALVCDDPDAPGGFVHWLVYGLAPEITSLPEGLPRDKSLTSPVCLQGVNDFGKIGYSGPAPPPGNLHHYRFTLYALSAPTGLPPGADEGRVIRAIEKNEITRATLEGLYGR